MTTAQAAALLGKTTWWVRRQCAQGELRAAYYGKTWNISQQSIDEYIAAHSNKKQPVSTRHRRRRAA
jgi:excisionase family DNA binding protein